MPYSAGTVFLQVVPSYRGFQESVSRQAKAAAKAFKGEFEKETGHQIADAIDKSTPDAKRAAGKLGTDVGNEMSGKANQAIQKRIGEALKNLPKVKVDADTTPLMRAVAAARKELETLGKGHASLDLDAGSVLAQLKAVEANLVEINRLAGRGTALDFDTAGAAASLARLSVIADEAARDRTLNVDADTAGARAQMKALDNEANHLGSDAENTANSFRAFNGVILAAVAGGPALIPILAALAGGLAAIGPLAIAAGAGLGVMILGFSGIPGAVGALNDVAKNGAKDALASEKAIRTASNGIRDAEQSLARAREQAARSQADSARRVADARRSLADAEASSSQRIKDALRAESDARQNAKDVALRNARDIAQAQRRLADARTAVARTEADAARRNSDALAQVASAERGVVEAQQSALKAQEALTDARREAQQDLEDLAAKAAGGALAEREAVLAVADAKKAYDRVMGRDFKSARSVEEVTLAYQEAELALSNIRRENGRTADELADANAKGVEGSDKVQNAQQGVLDAQQAQTDAAANLADAESNATQTRLDGIQAVNDAIDNQADAERNLRETRADAARAEKDAQQAIRDAVENTRQVRTAAAHDIADAERGITNAIRDQHQAATDAAYAIQQAQQGLADAQSGYQEALAKTGDIGSSSMQKLHDAMAQLSPAGQDFARFIFGLKDEFMALRGVAEAGLLPGVQDFLERVIDKYGPGFTKWVGAMATVAGDLFREFGKVITQNPMWQEFFGAFGKLSPKLFHDFGEMTINWLTVFVALMDAFLPLANMASDWLVKMSEHAADWASNLEDTKGFQDFMGYLKRVMPEVGAFFAALMGAVVALVRALAPYGELLMNVLTHFLNFIAGMSPGVLAAIVFGIVAITVALQVAYGVMTLMLVGFTAFEVTVGAWVAISVLVIAALVAMYLKFDWFRAAVDFVFGLLKDVMMAYWEYVKFMFNAYADIATWLWEQVLSPTFDAMMKGWRVMSDAAKWAWDNILKPTWDAIAVAANWLWDHVLSPVFGYISSAWHTLATGIKWVWDNIWFPIIDLVGTVIMDLWKLEIKIAFDAITLGWRAVADAVQWAWDHVMKPAWDAIGAGIAATWNNVIKPIFDFFMDTLHGKDGLEWVFQHAVDAIGTIWSGLEALAKAPIKFIVETVINGGLIGTFNKIADFFGTKKMGEIPLPKGFATGGYTGAGGRYEPAGIVHRDEFVVSSPARQRFERRNPGALDYLNRTGSLPGYATGGVVRPVNAAYGLPFGNTYKDGSFHSGQDFPVGVGTKVYAAILGVVESVLHLAGSYGNHVVMKHPGGSETLYAHLSKTLVNVGDMLAAGTLLGLSGTSGNSTGPHLHFEFRKPPGGYSNAVNPLSILGGAKDSDGGGFFPDWMTHPFGFLKDKVTGLLSKMPGAGMFGKLAGEIPMSLLGMAGDAIGGFGKNILGKAGDAASGAWDFVNGPFGGAGSHTALYDQGGMLPPGINHVINASRKPEAVLTNAQWQQIENVANGGHAPGLVTGDLYAVDPEDMVRKIRTSQSDAAAVHNIRSIASGV